MGICYPLSLSIISNASCRPHAGGRYQGSISDTRDKFIKDSSSNENSKSASLETGSDVGKRKTFYLLVSSKIFHKNLQCIR